MFWGILEGAFCNTYHILRNGFPAQCAYALILSHNIAVSVLKGLHKESPMLTFERSLHIAASVKLLVTIFRGRPVWFVRYGTKHFWIWFPRVPFWSQNAMGAYASVDIQLQVCKHYSFQCERTSLRQQAALLGLSETRSPIAFSWRDLASLRMAWGMKLQEMYRWGQKDAKQCTNICFMQESSALALLLPQFLMIMCHKAWTSPACFWCGGKAYGWKWQPSQLVGPLCCRLSASLVFIMISWPSLILMIMITIVIFMTIIAFMIFLLWPLSARTKCKEKHQYAKLVAFVGLHPEAYYADHEECHREKVVEQIPKVARHPEKPWLHLRSARMRQKGRWEEAMQRMKSELWFRNEVVC